MQQWLVFFALFVCPLVCPPVPTTPQHRRCVYLSSARNTAHLESAGSVRGQVQHCADTPCCMGYFKMVDGQFQPDLQGCNVIPMQCPEDSCFASMHRTNITTCVCNTDFCNANLTWLPTASMPAQGTPSLRLYSSSFLVILLLVICGLILAVRWTKHLQNTVAKPHASPERMVTSQCSCHRAENLDLNLADLELHQMLCQGQFASVWKGCHGGSGVAVKVFCSRYRHQFLREKDVYTLALMEHVGVVRFLGVGTLLEGTVLVLELAQHGSLRSFLVKNTSSWACSVRLAQSLSQGLAFLHSDCYRHGIHKPAVAHGDLSSSNVLVRADGTCALCDFGCSTVLRSCHSQLGGWQQHKDTCQVSGQVGTLCYMSPEILEGCVNLCNSRYLLQGDVYSLGLLLWELWTRCLDLSSDALVPEHRLPYEAELGSCPSLEELVHFVCERRGRPCVPKQWGQCLQGCFSIREILEDCWDHDPEARLTTQCAADRLAALSPCLPM